MERKQADAMAGLYHLSGSSFDYRPLSLPEKVPGFSIIHFSLLRPYMPSRKLTEAASTGDHPLLGVRGGYMGKISEFGRRIERLSPGGS
jgi:hypothetical protein